MPKAYPIGQLESSPEGREAFLQVVQGCLQGVAPELVTALVVAARRRDPEAVLALEEALLRSVLAAAGRMVAGFLQVLHRDAAWVAGTVGRARAGAGRPTRSRGWRSTPVASLGGVRMLVHTPYVADDLRGRPGPTRARGRRGPSGGGRYPVLDALGIAHGATPALRSEVARQTVRGSSFEEARAALSERGIVLDRKTVRDIALDLGSAALVQREARQHAARDGAVLTEELAGRRVVVSVDGGRIRLREGGDRGRRGKRKGRRYRTPWREPKVIAIYVIDEKGRKVSDLPIVYDATLCDADATFSILATELKLRGGQNALELIMVGDGAPWIWNRAEELARTVGLDPAKITEVADFYHAVEHLTAIAELCTRWTEDRRKRWVKSMRHKLVQGKVLEVIAAAKALCRGRNARRLRTEVEYFETRKSRMRYRTFRRRGIPLGSGAVESAIRRVVNLRLKGPSMFWRGPNAERMLHLRAYFKAGRWDELMRRVLYRSPDGGPAPEAVRVAA
jgi:hypothetical protein